MKIAVFPNDPLLAYYNKGEIKERYFNPNDMFDEVHAISTCGPDTQAEKVQDLAGMAKLKIHSMGKATLFNYGFFQDKITDLLKIIKPDVIRSYNPLLQGWLAVKAGKKLNIPVIISIHTNYDQSQRGKFRRYMLDKIERYVLSNATNIICIYESILPRARAMGARKIKLIYNKIDTKKFSPNAPKQFTHGVPTIISVGQLIDQKPHAHLIEAIKDLDARLLIIGEGPNYKALVQQAYRLGIKDKVEFIPHIPNYELPGYYTSCAIYAQPMDHLAGVPIPVFEAMACGLPVAMPPTHEITDDAILPVMWNQFGDAIRNILTDEKLRDKMKAKSLEVIRMIDGMEEKESKLYQELINNTIIQRT